MNIAHRFWLKVERGAEDECWPWMGYKHPSGHGLTTHQSLSILASRKAWVLTHGPIHLRNACVNHRCDNAACCNPKHLYLGTRSDNMVDRWANTAPDERAGFGRPHVLSYSEMEDLWQMRRHGATLAQCAEKFGVHRATVARYITAERKKRVARLRADRLSVVAKVSL